MIRNLPNTIADYQWAIGMKVIKPNLKPIGIVQQIVGEEDALWHNHKVYLVLDSGERIPVHHIGKKYTDTIGLKGY